MNSDISIRTIALSSSNRYSATALVSSVLPTPVGPRNRNEPKRAVLVIQTCSRTAHGIGYGFHRRSLTDHALAELRLPCVAVCRAHLPASCDVGTPVQRSTTCAICSGRTASSTIRSSDPSASDSFAPTLGSRRRTALQLSPDCPHALRYPVQHAHGRDALSARATFQLVTLGLPFRCHLGGTLLQVGQLFFQSCPRRVFGSSVILFLERLGLDLQLQDRPIKRVEFFWLADRLPYADATRPHPSGQSPYQARTGP